MDIKVVGTGCSKCSKLYENAVNAVQQLQLETCVEKVEDLLAIVKLGIMTTPVLLINGKSYGSGRVLSQEEIVELLQKQE